MTRLDGLKDNRIYAIIPILQKEGEANHFQEFELCGIEPCAGIWVKSQEVSDEATGMISIPPMPQQFEVFVPFHEVTAIVDKPEMAALLSHRVSPERGGS